MSITNLQNKHQIIANPVEIDLACNQLRELLGALSWISHPFHIAQRFYQAPANGKKAFYYPETYIKNPNEKGYNYHKLTADNDYVGMFFFMVGNGKIEFFPNENNFITYPVSIIFSVNLELIDKAKLKQEHLFTQELIAQARQRLTSNMANFDFTYKVVSETRDLQDVYREFVLDEIDQYNRAPLQCFRIELQVQIQENC